MTSRILYNWIWNLGLLMAITMHLISGMDHDCNTEDCVSLHECPVLARLFPLKSDADIKKLQEATCFIENSMPMVCCVNKMKTQSSKKNVLIPHTPGSCGIGQTRGLQRIYGGHEAPIGGYPWIAALGYTDPKSGKVQFLCAGSIINDRYILTAAHCVDPVVLTRRKLAVISVGEWDLATDIDCERTRSGLEICADPSHNVTHEEIIIHPDYNIRAPHSDDIALIRLSTKLELSAWVEPVCLPPQGLDIPRLVGRRNAVVAGWGTTETGQGSSRLLNVLLPIERIQFCNQTYGGKMVKGQICFGGDAGEDSCSGDSGGPLVLAGPTDKPPFLLIGLVSYGPSSCGQASIPGVYTSVTEYRNWIDANVRS